MSDVFLVLAQAPGGLTCFVVPRVLDDGTRNPFALQRLKDKLGNHSNASSEVELDGTWGCRLGDEGRGVRTIIDMVRPPASTASSARRPRCATPSARAVHHARHRTAFGALLVDQPLMRNVLADLALEAEAATVLGLRLAHAVDAGETELARLGVALGKFWVCKRTAADGRRGARVPRRQRLRRGERPGPALPRGAAQLDLGGLRQRQRPRRPARRDARAGEPRGADQGAARGARAERRARRAHGCRSGTGRSLDPTSPDAAFGARAVVERLALALQASLLVQHSPAPVADAFVASRIAGRRGHTFGSLDVDLAGAASAVIDRAG